jgi:predicted Zn-dependent protease
MMDAAIRDVKYTLDRFPNHPKGLMLLGVVARLTNDPSFAVNYYKRALSLFPQYAITHVQYGEYLVSVGLTNEGIGQLKRAIEIDPKLAVAYAGLAKAYAKGGNSELSRQAAKQARELGYTGKIGGQSSER